MKIDVLLEPKSVSHVSKKRERFFLGLLMILSVSLMAMTSKTTMQVTPARTYVMSYKDFQLHNEVHAANVERLGMALYEKYKDTEFKRVPRQILFEKLRMHDHEKLASEQELKAWGYQHYRSFGERLYDYYGEDKAKLSVAEKERFQDLVEEMNEYSSKFELSFYQKYGLVSDQPEFNEVIEKISMIERIADVVEREGNPISIEEFHSARLAPAEDFLATDSEKNMARYLRDGYDKTVQSNPLEEKLQAITRIDKLGSRHGSYVN